MASAVVLGGRNVGGAIIDRLIGDGWNVAGISRSAETAAASERRGASSFVADALDRSSLRAAFTAAADAIGEIDLVVNAISVAPTTGSHSFGGGSVADADDDVLERWTIPTQRVGFHVLAEAARMLRSGNPGGAIVQVTNGRARRSQAGQGPWSAGHAGVRALVHAAAEELRLEGIHVALLIIDVPVDSPRTAARIIDDGLLANASVEQSAIADAVIYLAGQEARGMSYELLITSTGQRWVS